MNERPIAEIIGWERHERVTLWRQQPDGTRIDERTSAWFTKPGVIDLDGWGMTPDVDDMLAWLLTRPAFVYDNRWYGPCTMWGSKLGFIVTLTDSDGDEVSSDCQSTLRAALEQLVRLIDNCDRNEAHDDRV